MLQKEKWIWRNYDCKFKKCLFFAVLTSLSYEYCTVAYKIEEYIYFSVTLQNWGEQIYLEIIKFDLLLYFIE